MLNSTEHEISMLIKTKIPIKKFLALSLSDVVFILLINVKMPTIVGILTFMSRITSGPGITENIATGFNHFNISKGCFFSVWNFTLK